VLDVGAGMGLLSWLAYKAGARKVYAQEASGAAKSTRKLMKGTLCSFFVVVLCDGRLQLEPGV
jgi:predicted RNA methylase